MPGQLAPGLIAVDGNHELAIDLQYAEVLRMHKARSKVVGVKLKTQAALLDPFEPIPCDPCHQRPKLTSQDGAVGCSPAGSCSHSADCRSLLLNEVRNKLGTPLWVTIGSVVSTATLREIGNAQGASAYLKQLTESLAYR
jgi:hypothetical protein